MPPRGVSWEGRAAIISLAKLLDFRNGVLPKIILSNLPRGQGLDAFQIQQYRFARNFGYITESGAVEELQKSQ